MKVFRLFYVALLLFVVRPAQAEEVLSYQCSAMKLLYNAAGSISGFEEVFSTQGARALKKFNSPFYKYVHVPFVLDHQSGSLSFNVNMGGVDYNLTNNLSIVIAIPPKTNNKNLGVCQFSSDLTKNADLLSGGVPKVITQASFGSQKYTPRNAVDCRQMTIKRGESFLVNHAHTTIDNSFETLTFGCEFTFTKAE